MKIKKIQVGESYRHKDNPNYCWAKVVKILKPKQDENTNSYTVVKCEWSTDKHATVGIIKYFKPSELR